MRMSLEKLTDKLMLGSLLDSLAAEHGRYEILDHWQQGEFHHDLLISLPQGFLIVATNCNGGVKEILSFDSAPERSALWHYRCPDNPEFSGELPPILERATTIHWFDPCEILRPDALSEYRPEYRERQPGGGWKMKKRCH